MIRPKEVKITDADLNKQGIITTNYDWTIVEIFDCIDTRITYMPPLPRCKELWCSNCPLLLNLPDFSSRFYQSNRGWIKRAIQGLEELFVRLGQ